jgi:hypothetical protein
MDNRASTAPAVAEGRFFARRGLAVLSLRSGKSRESLSRLPTSQ